MARENNNKINSLIRSIPRNAIITTKLLKKHKINSKLAWWYVQSRWLDHLFSGAYKFSDVAINWVSVIHALQSQLELPIHIGAKTALDLLGKSHYIPSGFLKREIQIISQNITRLPIWVNKLDIDTKFKLISTNSLANSTLDNRTLIDKEFDGLTIRLSSPEMAAIEICHLVSRQVTFQEAALLIENLIRLRPTLVQTLLETCSSIKTKRLFLYLSEYFNHEWLSDLDLTKIELGENKRQIAGGGVYNAKYKISVPPLGE